MWQSVESHVWQSVEPHGRGNQWSPMGVATGPLWLIRLSVHIALYHYVWHNIRTQCSFYLTVCIIICYVASIHISHCVCMCISLCVYVCIYLTVAVCVFVCV